MKKQLTLTLLLFVATLHLHAQLFEGEITYKMTYKSKLPNVTDEQFGAMMGSEMTYSIKKGDYRNSFNGNFMQYQLYVNKDNKLYNKFSNSETLFWKDCSADADVIINRDLKKNTLDILGYRCDELTLTIKNGTQKYYYNATLGIDAKLYENHKYTNWYDFVSISHAVPLKFYVENAQFILEGIATSIKPMNIDSKTFALPVGIETAKSPY